MKRDLLKIFPEGLFQMLGPSGKISPKMRILHKYNVSLLELYWGKAEKNNRKAACLSFSTATTFYLVWKHLSSSILSRYCSLLTFMFRWQMAGSDQNWTCWWGTTTFFINHKPTTSQPLQGKIIFCFNENKIGMKAFSNINFYLVSLL